MELGKIVKKLDLEVMAGFNNEAADVEGAYIGDLLSLVMAKAKPRNIWITIQTHINIVAVSTLVDLSAIIIAEGMDLDDDTLKKADEVNIPIFRSPLSAYSIACRLNELGV